MKHRSITIAIYLSGILLGLTILLFLASFFIDAQKQRLSLSPHFHISIVGRNWCDARLTFFSDRDWGPYQGGIIGFTDNAGNIYPPMLREQSFGDTLGIYYRYFERSYGTLWTLSISLWYPIVLFSLLPGWAVLRISRRRTAQGLY